MSVGSSSANHPGSGAAAPSAPLVVYASEAMARVIRQAIQAAASDAKILVTGESGVGKDLIARTVHAHSRRRGAAYVAVNCASFTETLLESELFGHVRGSFTGAYRDKLGQLQLAHRGTLFLDEVAEMSPRMQAMLLRVLENGEMQPVGSDRPNRVDVRIIAATNRDLGELVAARAFREDLLYRLSVIHLHIPPLRERLEDVPTLVAHVLARTGRRKTVSDAAMQVLTAHRWPGNVRELRNVIEQAVTLSVRDVIWPDDLPVQVRGGGPRPGQASERRRQVADELFEALVAGNCAFWAHVHPLFLSRDLTRHDVRELVRRGLARTRGNYRALLRLFGMSGDDYKKFLNFLAAHDCSVDFRPFRSGEGVSPAAVRPPRVLLPDSPMPAPPGAARPPGRP